MHCPRVFICIHALICRGTPPIAMFTGAPPLCFNLKEVAKKEAELTMTAATELGQETADAIKEGAFKPWEGMDRKEVGACPRLDTRSCEPIGTTTS